MFKNTIIKNGIPEFGIVGFKNGNSVIKTRFGISELLNLEKTIPKNGIPEFGIVIFLVICRVGIADLCSTTHRS